MVARKASHYLQVIRKTYPKLDINSARLHTADGQFNDIVFINENLIFRFPRYEESINGFLRQIELLQKLQGYTSLSIPNPIYTNSGTKSAGEVFMGYEMIDGRPLFRETINALQNKATLNYFAQQLANFLCRLHNVHLRELNLNLATHNHLEENGKLYADVQTHLFGFMRPDAREAVKQHFENYFCDLHLHEYTPALCHGDFGESNILFKANKITGIIDFDFANLGDPAIDLAAISTFGEAFFDRICNYYLPNESVLKRAEFYRGTFALYEALHGFRNNDKDAFTSGMERYI